MTITGNRNAINLPAIPSRAASGRAGPSQREFLRRPRVVRRRALNCHPPSPGLGSVFEDERLPPQASAGRRDSVRRSTQPRKPVFTPRGGRPRRHPRAQVAAAPDVRPSQARRGRRSLHRLPAGSGRPGAEAVTYGPRGAEAGAARRCDVCAPGRNIAVLPCLRSACWSGCIRSLAETCWTVSGGPHSGDLSSGRAQTTEGPGPRVTVWKCAAEAGPAFCVRRRHRSPCA